MPVRTERDPFDRLTPGTQALVLTDSLRSPLATLPPAAFENLLVISTTRPAHKVEQFVQDRGGDPNRVGVVPVSGSPVDYDGPLWTTSVVYPNDLTGIHDRFERALGHVKPGTGWVVFDNVNVLSMYAERSAVGQLVDSATARTRERTARGVFALVRDAVTDSTYERFGGTMDVELDYREH
ncbi:hypothetical protein [Haloarchaeobius sp. FL176]|uniref:DUF7504 family protein n=1 Tax=Haloarchaeobius sp. FL176 TaxID=2967129 RepID=UPI002147EF5D|nr:hypothetical protein [Haloarchaeobius sp. FL176]